MTMDSIEKLTTAITIVEEARGVPLSASCVVHRGEMLELLEDARAVLPSDLAAAEDVLAQRDQIIEEGRASAESMIATARETIQNEKMAAITELKNQVATLSIEIAEKVIRQQLASDDKQKALVNDLLKDVKLN